MIASTASGPPSAGVRVSCPAVWRRAGSFRGLLAGERRAISLLTEGRGLEHSLCRCALCRVHLLVSYRR